jgi:hypothetical protein
MTSVTDAPTHNGAAAEAFADYLAGLDTDARSAAVQRALARAADGTDAAKRLDLGKFAAPAVASGIKPVTIDWLWRGFLPLGALCLLYGEEGGGKSALTALLAAHVTRGTLPGSLAGSPASVEFVPFEDDPASVVVPRLLAAGADLSRVYIHGEDSGDGLLTLPDDVERFGAALEARASKLVVIDPLPDALRDGLKDNNNGDVRKGIIPLHRLAQELGVTFLGVAHPNKGATDAANKVMGSKAWRSVPRSVLIYGRDPDEPEDDGKRIIAVSKANYSAKRSERVAIESVAVEGVAHPQPRAAFKGESAHTDQDVILANVGRVKDDGNAGGQLGAAERLLFRLLEDGGGEIEPRVAYKAAKAAGISERTMRRTREQIGVVVAPGRRWKLPEGLPI